MKLPFELDRGIGTAATLGLIVLQNDETLECEAREITPLSGVALYHSRIPMCPQITPETLIQMETDLPQAAAMLPEAAPLDVIGYGCTSAATVIGSDAVRDAIRRGRPSVEVTDPLRALIAACQALNARKVGFVTPYVADVSAQMREQLCAAGHQVVGFGSFEESDDRAVARITPASIQRAIETVAQQANCDAVIVACTNLRVAHIIADCEDRIGVPVLSSNTALLWHMLTLAGHPPALSGFGRLLSGR